MKTRTVRIVIADDHTILRDGLRALLESQPDVEVVGEAANGRDAIRVVNERQPDVLVTDVTMPLTNGTDAIRILKKRHPHLKCVALTIHGTERYVRAALGCGADAYVLKEDSITELLHAIRHVLQGKKFLSTGISTAVVAGYLDGPLQPQNLAFNGKLTHRECETLKLIAEGLKNKQIAAHLCVSVKTVEKHRANLMRKLDLHSGPALTAYAFENGLVANQAFRRSADPSSMGMRATTTAPFPGEL
ncbi:MAG: response regulator transcription factor [Gammaproteobacteria bacterium]|nr:response regulator transcription factor [Gammaproteobacteria bacterium]